MKRLLLMLTILVLLAGFSAGIAEQEITYETLSISPGTEILDLDAAGIRVTDVKALAEAVDQLPGLKEVLLYDSPLETADMEWLFDRYYPDIFFGFTLQIGPHIIRTDRTAFSTLHLAGKMKDDERHNTEDLEPIRMCTKLKALDLGHNYIENIDFLNWMPELEVLILSPNYGRLLDISPIANCPNLVYLELFSSRITDLTPLSGLTKLRDLTLTRCTEVRDLSPIYELPNLERVWWGLMNRIKAEQKRTMKQLHPNCKFVTVDNPTEGGWRKHSHYKELHEFFRTGVYVPFSE